MLQQQQDLSASYTGGVRLLRPQRGAAASSCALADPAGPGRVSPRGCRAAGAAEEGCRRDEAPGGRGERSDRSDGGRARAPPPLCPTAHPPRSPGVIQRRVRSGRYAVSTVPATQETPCKVATLFYHHRPQHHLLSSFLRDQRLWDCSLPELYG